VVHPTRFELMTFYSGEPKTPLRAIGLSSNDHQKTSKNNAYLQHNLQHGISPKPLSFNHLVFSKNHQLCESRQNIRYRRFPECQVELKTVSEIRTLMTAERVVPVDIFNCCL